MKKLETERILLRKFKKEDLDDFFEYAQMEEVGPNSGWAPIVDKEKAAERLKRMLNDDYYAIVLKKENKVIGSVSLSIPDKRRYENIEIEDESRELGFSLSKNYWGHGYGTEAVNEIIKYAFENMKIPAIYTTTNITNIPSERLQEKCGLAYVGTMPNVKWLGGQIVTMVQRKISSEDYFKK